MKELAMVGLGGLVGSILRYRAGAAVLHQFPDARFPWGTFLVNILGSLFVGIVAALLERLPMYNAELRLLLITGFLGGFTTFSAFGLETVTLIRNGNVPLAALNVIASVVVGLIAVWAGFRLAGIFGTAS